MDDERTIQREGELAFDKGVPAADCPYSFNKTTFWTTKDYSGFATVRWKLDAWMIGWLQAKKETNA